MLRLTGLGRTIGCGFNAMPHGHTVRCISVATSSSAQAVAHHVGVLGRAALPHVPPTPLLGTGVGVAAPARGFASRKHKKLIKLAKGYRGRANSVYSVALQRVTKALQYVGLSPTNNTTKNNNYTTTTISIMSNVINVAASAGITSSSVASIASIASIATMPPLLHQHHHR